jgi:hypothetical protein
MEDYPGRYNLISLFVNKINILLNFFDEYGNVGISIALLN